MRKAVKVAGSVVSPSSSDRRVVRSNPTLDDVNRKVKAYVNTIVA